MSAASRCLNNPLILQKVLESSDLLANLQFRLVDKRFDREILHRIRVSHRKIYIYVVVDSLPKVEVNGSLVNPRDCFKFLINTAGVRVEEFEVVPDRKLMDYVSSTPLISREIHDDIVEVLLKDQNLNVFKGMVECQQSGCDECLKHAMQSKEYGPVQAVVLSPSFKEPKHFDLLIVNDEEMCYAACFCDLSSRDQNRGELVNFMARVFHSNISCDHLQLPLYNHPDFYKDGQRAPIEPELAREILDEMCMKWKPKSVGLSVIPLLFGRDTEAYWAIGHQNFTEFRFFDPFESTRVSRGFMLDHVDVDLDDAPLKEIFREDSRFFDDNLIANVRKVFPARHYFVNLHRMSTCHQLDQCRIEQLIRAVIRGSNQSNTCPVTVCISTDITDKPFDIPETLSVGERVLTCSVSRNSIEDVFGTTRRIAKSFIISDKNTGIEMNLEVYVDKKQLEEAIGKHVYLGLLKHYIACIQ